MQIYSPPSDRTRFACFLSLWAFVSLCEYTMVISLCHFLSSNSIKRICLMMTGMMALCLWWTHWLFQRHWSMHINVPGFFVLSVALRNLLMLVRSRRLLCWIGLESDMYNVPFKNVFGKVEFQISILTRTFSSYLLDLYWYDWFVFIYFVHHIFGERFSSQWWPH